MLFKEVELNKKLIKVFALFVKDKEGGLLFLQKYFTPHISGINSGDWENTEKVDEFIDQLSPDSMESLFQDPQAGKALGMIYALLSNYIVHHPQELKEILNNKEKTAIHKELEQLLQQDAQKKEEVLSDIRKKLV